MKKKLLLVLMLITALVVIPRVSAAEGNTIVPGTVTDITKTDTLTSAADATTKSLVTEGNVTTIRYDVATFKLLGTGDNSENRPDNKAWIGVSVAKPTNATKYTVKFNGQATDINNKEINGNSSYDEYIGFSKEDLLAAAKNGTVVTKTLEVTWSSDTEGVASVTQTINIVVNPKGITLKAKESDTDEWNTTQYEENIKKVTVTVKAIKDGEEVELEEPVSYELKEVYTLSEEQIAEIQKVLTDENLDLVGLYTDVDLKSEFDATEEITEDVTVYVAYKTKATNQVEEETPETLDNAIMFIALAGVSLAVVGGIAIYLKKSN